jgi:MerR family transcriptional regulator/heat shock protein HspR
LAGIEIILRMKEQMEEMERQIQKLLEIIQKSLREEESEEVKAIVLSSKSVVARLQDIINRHENKGD